MTSPAASLTINLSRLFDQDFAIDRPKKGTVNIPKANYAL